MEQEHKPTIQKGTAKLEARRELFFET